MLMILMVTIINVMFFNTSYMILEHYHVNAKNKKETNKQTNPLYPPILTQCFRTVKNTYRTHLLANHVGHIPFPPQSLDHRWATCRLKKSKKKKRCFFPFLGPLFGIEVCFRILGRMYYKSYKSIFFCKGNVTLTSSAPANDPLTQKCPVFSP